MGLILSVPIGNNTVEGTYRKAQYELDQSVQQLAELENRIRYEVRRAWRWLELAMEKIATNDKVLEAARKRYEAEEERFRVGLAKLIDVITYQREYVRALADAKVSRTRYAVETADFERVQGRLLDSLQMAAP